MKFKSVKPRVLVVRSALAVVYVGIILLMMVTGRSHTILIDNKGDPQGAFGAVEGMEVSIDKLESSEYYPGDRDKAVVKGQRHSITVDLFMEGRVEKRDFKVPFGQDMVLLSVPKMLAGMEPWIEPFSVRTEAIQSNDGASNQGMQFGGDAPVEAEALPPDASLIQ